MSDYKATNKTKCIRIFYDRKSKINGVTYPIKHYVHPQNTKLYAQVRNLSQSEVASNSAVYDSSTIQVIMNYRKLNNDMFIEFRNKTYQLIGDPDEFDFQDTEIKLFCKRVVPKTDYYSTEYEEWATEAKDE
jgi:head-tail adaptor